MVLAIVTMVIHFVLAILFVIWGIIRFFTRTLYDSMTFVFLKMFARVPGIDTSMAWKIGGPGVGRTYFYSIEDEDFILLI